MKSAFDVYYGGCISSKAQVAERVRQLKQPVELEPIEVVRSRLAASEFVGPLIPRKLLIQRLLESRIKPKKEWSCIESSKSAPFVGDIVGPTAQ
jgi:hypothetical protein